MKKEISDRLDSLSLKVSSYRACGKVKFWPEDVRQEALLLSHECSRIVVVQRTGLASSLISQWKKDKSVRVGATAGQPQPSRHEEIVVSRIDVKKSRLVGETPSAKVSIHKSGVEVRVFCPELAWECVRGTLS